MQSSQNPDLRYRQDHLIQLATTLLEKAGLSGDRALVVATTLVEADLMEHTTHGLALLPAYLEELENGGMTKSGQPEIINDTGATITWDGHYLPGPWLVKQAIELALDRIKEYPVMTIVIRNSHHIACLATYLEKVACRGFLIQLSCSDPVNATVAPFGGLEGVYSPNPMAVGIPTNGDPIIFDISMSTTANGVVIQKQQAGEPLPHPWLLDAQGHTTNDPAAFYQNPPATILPLGGLDTGYKGFSLGLLVEALTSGLAGGGRSEKLTRWGGSVHLQITDPEAFNGLDYFKREMDHLVKSCLGSAPRKVDSPVRIPGSRALAKRKEQMENGVHLYPDIMPAIKTFGLKYKVDIPSAI